MGDPPGLTCLRTPGLGSPASSFPPSCPWKLQTSLTSKAGMGDSVGCKGAGAQSIPGGKLGLSLQLSSLLCRGAEVSGSAVERSLQARSCGDPGWPD